MGSENSTDSVSSASSMVYRLRAGLRNFARAVYSAAMRVARRPIPRIAAEKEVFVIATKRDSFVWNVTRGRKGSSEDDLPPLFVRVEPDPFIEEPKAEEWPEEPIAEKVYSTPSYSTISPTSSGAVMYEFSSSRFDLDMLDMEESEENEVFETPVYMNQYESEEERQFFESLYEDLEVEAVLAYMDTIDLYATDYESICEDLAVDTVLDYMDTVDIYHSQETAEPAVIEEAQEESVIEECAEPAIEPVIEIAGYLEAPVSNIAGYLEAPVSNVCGLIAAPECLTAETVQEAPVIESEEERQFFESLYEDLEVEAVLAYMDTIELCAIDYESICEDLAVDAVLDYMDTVDIYHCQKTAEPAVMEEVKAETEEEKRFYESIYEDLTVFAVLDYMDTIELYAKPAPEYVISEIEAPEECETVIEIEQPRYEPDYVISEIASSEECETVIEIEQPVAEEPIPVKQSILAQFIFGFDAPARASPGPTKFRFIAGTEEESDDDVEDVQVMTYSGDAAVSAQSFSNGPLAL